MARITIAALQARINELTTELAAVPTAPVITVADIVLKPDADDITNELRDTIAQLAPLAAQARKANSFTLWVKGEPKVTYFTRAAAYAKFEEFKKANISAQYRPAVRA